LLNPEYLIFIKVESLKARGMEFLHTPDKYYTNLRERLKTASIKVSEDIDVVIIVIFTEYMQPWTFI